MNNDNQVKDVAKSIYAILKSEGVKVSINRVIEIIKDEDVSDVSIISKVRSTINSNDMRINKRQQNIEKFMINNWSQIKNDEILRTVFLDAYCRGRIDKNKRKKLQDELLERCDASTKIPNEQENIETDNTEFDF